MKTLAVWCWLKARIPRILEAAVTATARGIADITLLGDASVIQLPMPPNRSWQLEGVSLVNPAEAADAGRYAETFYELRKAKGMTPEKAAELMRESAALCPGDGAPGRCRWLCLWRGLYHRRYVVRAAIQIIGMAEDASMVSSFFLMMLCEPFHELKGGVIFSDCGLVINPDAPQLAQIAMSASASARNLLGEEPRVAMLSFSTSGSASHSAVDKVVEATRIVKEQHPDLAIDGDVQLDAAIVSEIAERKVAHSETHGKANVLVFPNLEAGNIGYKLAERIGKAEAIGPILQGLRKPANDLSRGCSANDVVNVIAITVVQSQSL